MLKKRGRNAPSFEPAAGDPSGRDSEIVNIL